ncbi:M48 family metallopeptidase [Otariodibacter oris]|uniref:Zn-dependent protease with chaperone function n=1 Tax=Otariodibacter oris TaxID=1032623 RepID=A0A420XFB5_9PAST|nr:M48 family metallopeptidase [Otariodibacter oris]QGM81598.1 deoxyribonuclease HsdR [Otariodibacter oris]RKR71210.1 Zn-dependent protease with chaperone function [Otariodibacter oris]
MKLLKKVGLISFFTLILSACVTTQQMNAQAASQYNQVKQQASAQGALDTSSSTARRVRAVFNKMKPYAEQENTTGVPFQWEIMVIRSNDLNAWAMPGGKMAFYTGLVEKLNLNDDEIATVMGHEMTHALKEHSKAGANRSAVIDTAFAITQAVVGDVNVGGYSGLGMLKAYGLDRPFSRSDETEADELGLYLMAKSGYNPRAASQLWIKMGKATGGAGGFFSTHPADSDRQANLEKWLPKALEYYNARR